MTRASAFFAAALLAHVGFGAQRQPHPFGASADAVAGAVRVLKRDGRPVVGPGPGEFVVSGDGKPRPVRTADFVSLAGTAAGAQWPTAASRTTALVRAVEQDLRVIDRDDLPGDERKQCDEAKSLVQRVRRMLEARGEHEAEALPLAVAASNAVAPVVRRQLRLDRLMAAAEQYRSGNVAAALQALSGSFAFDLAPPVRYIEDNRDRLGVAGTALADVNDSSLAALCLLETEVAFLGRHDADARLGFALRLLGAASPARLPPRFVERWHIGVVGHLQGTMRLAEAMDRVEDAVRRFPEDTDILVVAGMFYELVAAPGVDLSTPAGQSWQGADVYLRGRPAQGLGKTSMETALPPNERDERLAGAKRTGVTRAEDFCRRAAAEESGPAEAHLRLGRILSLTARPGAALSELRRAAASRDPRTHYLASMFEGAVHEAAERLDAAIASCEDAVLACPTCLTGGIALSHAQPQHGAPDEAMRTLDVAVSKAGGIDFWWSSPTGTFWQRDALLGELRRSLQ